MGADPCGGAGTVRFGRRNGWLEAGQGHYNYATAIKGLDFTGLAAGVFESTPTAVAVWVYAELYGGWYPGMPTAGTKVQKGIHYSNANLVRVFDMFVQEAAAEGDVFHGETDVVSGRNDVGFWLTVHDAKARCDAAGVPFVKVCCEGSVEDMVEWARAHATDPADVEPGMPELERNEGEGHVIRASVGHYLVKIKNPAWADIGSGKPAGSEPSAAAAAATDTLIPFLPYLTPARAAAVFSKEAEDAVDMRNLAALVALFRADAVADMPEELRVAAGEGATAKRLTSLCFTVVREALLAR